ncbi:MAG: hypothetical protein ACRDXX_11335, partial [Stackebrandtia sp.]
MTGRRRLRRLVRRAEAPRPGGGLVARLHEELREAVDVAPGRVGGLAAGAVAVVVLPGFGVVAAALAAGYAAAGVMIWSRRRRLRRSRAQRRAARHAVSLLAAELRAGAGSSGLLREVAEKLPGAGAFEKPPDPVCRGLADRLRAVADVAEQTGAPAARLLDRLDAEVRSQARAA